MPKFSIVIATYNRLSWLQQAVASALAQTVPCQVIVVDDASTDGTEAYLQGLGGQIIYYRNLANLGYSLSVNEGVCLAQGDWIKLLDDDDYLAPDCIAKLVEAIAIHPQTVICSVQAWQINQQGQELRQTPPMGQGATFAIAQEDIHYGMLMDFLAFGKSVQVAFRKDAFLKSGGWDHTLSITKCDDLDFWVKIAQYGDALFINQCLVYHRLWSGNYSRKLSLQTQLANHLFIKEKLYRLVHPKYQAYLPKLIDICNFLKLNWVWIGWKRGNPVTALGIMTFTLFSIATWRYLAKVIYLRHIAPQILAFFPKKETIFPLKLAWNLSIADIASIRFRESHPNS
jgi:glycosyltransferase involved in cell wall biosynthesis